MQQLASMTGIKAETFSIPFRPCVSHPCAPFESWATSAAMNIWRM
jgi:hypothetical protein